MWDIIYYTIPGPVPTGYLVLVSIKIANLTTNIQVH